MRNKKRRVLLITALCLLAPEGIHTACAASVADAEINRGEYVDLVTPGQSEAETNVSAEHTTQTGGGKSAQATSAETNAHREQQNVRGILKKLKDAAASDAKANGYGVMADGKDLVGIGFVRVSEDTLERMLGSVRRFTEYVGQDHVNAYYNNQSEENGMLAKKSLASDRSVDGLTREEKRQIKEEIGKKEGIRISKAQTARFNLKGLGGQPYHMDFTGGSPLFAVRGHQIPAGGICRNEIRKDLILGGMNDFSSWNGRFAQLESYVSNAMEDSCCLSYLEDYHIRKADRHYVTGTQYTDKRRWAVYQAAADGSSPQGEPVAVEERTNEEHSFRFQGYQPGVYLVVPEQEAVYTVGMYVEYDICEYLFNTETRTMLYFRERLADNGKGGSIFLGQKKESGWQKTGDVFRVTVNDLGEVEQDGSATQRAQ